MEDEEKEDRKKALSESKVKYQQNSLKSRV